MLSDEVRELEEQLSRCRNVAGEMFATFSVNWERGNLLASTPTATKNWNELLKKWKSILCDVGALDRGAATGEE